MNTPRQAPSSRTEFRQFADSMPHVIWTAQADGTIDYLNLAYTRYTGSHQGSPEQRWLAALHPDDRDTSRRAWQQAIRHAESYVAELRLFNQAQGKHCWHAIRAEPVRGADGTLSHWNGIATDIHDHKVMSEKFVQLGARLNATFESMSEGFYILDHDWRFVYLNTAAESQLRHPASALLGQAIWTIFPEVADSPLGQALRDAASGHQQTQLEFFHASLERWFDVHIHPSEEGTSVFFQDISERKQAEQALQQTTRALRLLSRCNGALIRCDNETALLEEICRIALEVDGYQAAFVGYREAHDDMHLRLAAYACKESSADCLQQLQRIWPAGDALPPGPTAQAIRSGAPVMLGTLNEYPPNTPWGEIARRHALNSCVCLPLRDRKQVFGVLTLLQRDAREIAEDDVQLLQELADNLAFGIISLRAEALRRQEQNAIVKLAASTSASAGIAFFEQLASNMADALGAHASFVARILPEQPLRARTLAAVIDGQRVDDFDYLIEGSPCERLAEQALCVVADEVAERFPRSTSLAALGARAYVGHRLENSAGETVGFLFVLYRHPLSNAEFITSTLRVFADRAASELEREQIQARIRDQASLLDKAHDAIIVHDLQQRISFWNQSASRLYGWSAAEALGRSVVELIHHDTASFRQAVAQVLAHNEWVGEYQSRCKDGSLLTVEGSWTLVRDPQGAPQSILTLETDIGERKRMEAELLHRAHHDPLTGLANRAFFYEQLTQAMKRSRRQDSRLALLYFDIDKFKQINDSHGHDVGDEIIRRFAHRVQGAVREVDFMSRIGGDEFVLILEGLAEARCAEVVANKLLDAMATPFTVKGRSLPVSTSIGIALYQPGMSVDDLVRQADQAMYRAKRAGRNGFRY